MKKETLGDSLMQKGEFQCYAALSPMQNYMQNFCRKKITSRPKGSPTQGSDFAAISFHAIFAILQTIRTS